MAGKTVAFAGGRHVMVEETDIFDAFEELFSRPPDPVYDKIHVGDCPTGVDHAIRCYPWMCDIVIFEADWERLGKAAGPIRNERMLEHADALIAFWDGRSKGTLSAISIAARRGIPVYLPGRD